MTELLDRVEQTRLALGLTQSGVAAHLGVSQPHYSKVMAGVVPLSSGLEGRMRDWITAAQVPAAPRRDGRIRELSRSIQRQCRELEAMLARTDASARKAAPGRAHSRRK